MPFMISIYLLPDCFQYGLLKWENNLNNFYNFEQRFAGTLPLRGRWLLVAKQHLQRFALLTQLDAFPA